MANSWGAGFGLADGLVDDAQRGTLDVMTGVAGVSHDVADAAADTGKEFSQMAGKAEYVAGSAAVTPISVAVDGAGEVAANTSKGFSRMAGDAENVAGNAAVTPISVAADAANEAVATVHENAAKQGFGFTNEKVLPAM